MLSGLSLTKCILTYYYDTIIIISLIKSTYYINIFVKKKSKIICYSFHFYFIQHSLNMDRQVDHLGEFQLQHLHIYLQDKLQVLQPILVYLLHQ